MADQQHHHHQHHHIPGMEDVEGKISCEGISHVEAPSIHLHRLPERSVDIKDTDFLAHGQPPGVFSAELNLDKPKKVKDSTSQAHGALPGVFHWNETNTITETGTAHEGNLYSYKQGKNEAEKETYNEEQADKKGGDHWKVETSIAEGD